jgi:hypothetical protein
LHLVLAESSKSTRASCDEKIKPKQTQRKTASKHPPPQAKLRSREATKKIMREAPRDSSTISAGKKASSCPQVENRRRGGKHPEEFCWARESRRGGKQRTHQLGSAPEIDPLLPPLPRHRTELAANPQQEAAREGTGSMPRTATAAPVLAPETVRRDHRRLS